MTVNFGHFTVLLLYLLLTYAKRGEESIARDDTIDEMVLNMSHFNTALQELKKNFNALYKIYESQKSREYDTKTGEKNSIGTDKFRKGDAETELGLFKKKKIFLTEENEDYGEIMQGKRENMAHVMELRDNSNKFQLESKKYKGNINGIAHTSGSEELRPQNNNNIHKMHIIKEKTFPRNSIRHNITVNKPKRLQTHKEIVHINNYALGPRRKPSVSGVNTNFRVSSKKYTNVNERHNMNSRFNFYPIHKQKSGRSRMSNFQRTGETKRKTSHLEPERTLMKSRKALRLIDSLENFTIAITPAKTHRNSNIADYLDPEMTYELFNTDNDGLNFILQNREAKTDSLRRAYGNACLKTVVRKCYKGCLNAEKRACKYVPCGNALRDRIKYVSRAACIKEFLHDRPIKKNVSKDIKDENMRRLIRSGYSDCACLSPPQGHEYLHFKARERRLNTLRNKFESACREESSVKCEHACYYAANGACSVHNCMGKLKDMLKKACKYECQYVYMSKRTESSSGSSGTNSRSNGDSQSSGSHSESENSGNEKPEQNTTTKEALTTTNEKNNETTKTTKQQPTLTTKQQPTLTTKQPPTLTPKQKPTLTTKQKPTLTTKQQSTLTTKQQSTLTTRNQKPTLTTTRLPTLTIRTQNLHRQRLNKRH